MESEEKTEVIDFAEAKQIKDMGDSQVYISPDGEKWYPYSLEYVVEGRRFQLPFYARSRKHADQVFEEIKKGHVTQERIIQWQTDTMK